jgi:RNA polymerase sigma factor (sigma-70 family)
VKTNRKFAGNEDLYEDFFNETCRRSLKILSAVESEAALETYLRKIVTTSIINVLKNSGRLRRSKGSYIASNEVIVEDFTMPEPDTSVLYKNVEVKNVPEDLVIRKEVLDKIISTVKSIAAGTPEKQYLEIFDMRYTKHMTQKQMANALGLSQSEISKRLMKLMEGVKLAFNQG